LTREIGVARDRPRDAGHQGCQREKGKVHSVSGEIKARVSVASVSAGRLLGARGLPTELSVPRGRGFPGGSGAPARPGDSIVTEPSPLR